MRQSIILRTLFLCLSFSAVSFAKPNTKNASAIANVEVAEKSEDEKAAELSNQLYTELQLETVGLTRDALDYAVKGYEKLVSAGTVTNDQYLTVVDFSQSSRKKRFYLIDMQQHRLVWNTYVSHGKNSGVDEAERFSNRMNSEQSSLGFYLTKATYSGKHGLSLRLSGLDEGFNDNAEARGVVVHGASYVNENRVSSPYMGRSQGCPALPESEYAAVITLIKNGSVFFVYHPDEQYLNSSSVLNS
jgi:hypothetical protein